jgi:hypothetical protein
MQAKRLFMIGLFFLMVVTAAVIYDIQYSPAHHTLPPDPKTIYTIERKRDSAMKNSEGISSVLNYRLSYKTHWLGREVTGSVLVGRSAVDLAPYVGKQVRFEGSVNHSATQQCIKDQCHNPRGAAQKFTAVDIVSLSVR